jgi:hypothetical protein
LVTSRVQQAIRNGKPILLVELPGNSMELAQAAASGGADSVIAQLNNEHPVTHTYTGGLELELNQLRDFVNTLSIPVGVHVGAQARMTRDEWTKVLELKPDFLTASVVVIPPYLLKEQSTAKILYVPTGLPLDHYRSLGSFESLMALSFEAMSQTQPDPQVRFNALDVVNLDAVVRLSPVPVLFRASQDMEPEDVALVLERGCVGLILDPGFTGPSAEHYKLTTETFARALAGARRRSRFLGYSPWG